jgi:hypothetical protein
MRRPESVRRRIEEGFDPTTVRVRGEIAPHRLDVERGVSREEMRVGTEGGEVERIAEDLDRGTRERNGGEGGGEEGSHRRFPG